ncbi:MAG: hypothetical protein ABGX87_13920 [Alcanivorax sp.]|uniref:DUF7352 domain-containing protein n=1 Tax=Alloalcanivorax marinus TaxID=1177169 RepID=A0A9Q3UKA4_9GAMM|nr:hypothetical protein [Alloalcanivorax marinus]MBM7334927.1 hypothetical protein [Alloalcanivorax marinus]MCC4307960.1 hypothetical protein [Alloalcanivorax marinus]MCH2556851.1 hypothetical protein [Alcanivorax sp.]MCU5785163.1 hypothetical protein [Alloalcanivorax marinus]
MKTIHKHRLEIGTEVQEIRLPEEGEVLRVDYIQQERLIYMWVEVDADTVIDTPKEVRRFKVFTTGSGIPDNAVYLGTTLDALKPEAFHVYELVD